MAEQMAQPAADPAFPPTLAEVSGAERGQETFGFISGLLGAGLLVLAGALAFDVKPPGYGALAGIGAVGLLLVGYEVYRRRAPAVLVRRDNRIGVYRGGAFSSSFGVSQVTRFYLRHGNTLQHLIMPVMLAAVGVMIAVGNNKKPGEPKALLLALAGGAAVASIVRTRVLCHHYYIPKPKGKRSELIVLASADSERLFPSTKTS
jgi:hypothetical protein